MTTRAYASSLVAPRRERGVLFSDHELDEKSIVVIGDIHGCAQALRDLLTQVVNTECQLVFVGDLVDRGKNFQSVLTIVHSICTEPDKWGVSEAVCLMGNHERMILDAYQGYDIDLWLRNGGQFSDYEFISNTGRWGWINSLPLWYRHPNKIRWDEEDLNLLVTHGSVQPGVPLPSQDPMNLYWGREIQGYSTQYLTVHGHTICKKGEPLQYDTPTGKVLRIDTGSYATGIVTGVAFREVD